MTPEEFTEALKSLGWKQSDFCRMAGVDKSTPSRWMKGITPIPGWTVKFLQMARAVRALNAITVPPKS